MAPSTVGTLAQIPVTMSSLEIAKLTGKQHNNVLADIRNTFEQAEIDLLKFQRIETFANNRKRTIYLLPRAECDLIISGYSVKYRWAIIQRWHELERSAAQTTALPAPQITRRWLMTIDSAGREYASPVSDGALLLTITELADVIAEPGALMPSNAELATLAKACNDRLAMRLGGGVSARSDRSKGITRCPAG